MSRRHPDCDRAAHLPGGYPAGEHAPHDADDLGGNLEGLLRAGHQGLGQPQRLVDLRHQRSQLQLADSAGTGAVEHALGVGDQLGTTPGAPDGEPQILIGVALDLGHRIFPPREWSSVDGQQRVLDTNPRFGSRPSRYHLTDDGLEEGIDRLRGAESRFERIPVQEDRERGAFSISTSKESAGVPTNTSWISSQDVTGLPAIRTIVSPAPAGPAPPAPAGSAVSTAPPW